MKNYIECLAQAAAEQDMTIGEVFDNWLDKSYSKIFDKAAEIYTEQSKSHKPVVSGKRPTDDEITLVISEIANHYQSGLANSLHHQYYITKVRELFRGRVCQNEAVGKAGE